MLSSLNIKDPTSLALLLFFGSKLIPKRAYQVLCVCVLGLMIFPLVTSPYLLSIWGFPLDPFQLRLDPVQFLHPSHSNPRSSLAFKLDPTPLRACWSPTIPVEPWIGGKDWTSKPPKMETLNQFQTTWRTAAATNSLTWNLRKDFKQVGNCRLNRQQFPMWNPGTELTAGVSTCRIVWKPRSLALDSTICQFNWPWAESSTSSVGFQVELSTSSSRPTPVKESLLEWELERKEWSSNQEWLTSSPQKWWEIQWPQKGVYGCHACVSCFPWMSLEVCFFLLLPPNLLKNKI